MPMELPSPSEGCRLPAQACPNDCADLTTTSRNGSDFDAAVHADGGLAQLVMTLVASMKLLNAEPGEYLDG